MPAQLEGEGVEPDDEDDDEVTLEVVVTVGGGGATVAQKYLKYSGPVAPAPVTHSFKLAETVPVTQLDEHVLSSQVTHDNKLVLHVYLTYSCEVRPIWSAFWTPRVLTTH